MGTWLGNDFLPLPGYSSVIPLLASMNRRTFLERVCQSAAGLVIGGAVIDLSAIRTISAKSRIGINEVREIPINLTDTPELKPVGGYYHLTVEDLEREILVVHTAPSKYIAVDIKCTHGPCDLNYESKEKKFVCPCHGAEFDLTGMVIKGPAEKPLNYYYAEVRGEEVVVSVYGANDPAPARPAADPTIRMESPRSDSTAVDSLVRLHKKE